VRDQRLVETGEVFTPPTLANYMLDKLPVVWTDPGKVWLEPSAGDGNFLVEIKRRLLEAGHSEKHVLDNMIFSVELMDDNHWTLQHRLGYLVDGKPNPRLWKTEAQVEKWFTISKIDRKAQDLNGMNPYYESGIVDRPDRVYHHVHHVCADVLAYSAKGFKFDKSHETRQRITKEDLIQY